MWSHVKGFQNCNYHLEWPIVILKDPQICPILNPKETLFEPPINPISGSQKNSKSNLLKIYCRPQKTLFQPPRNLFETPEILYFSPESQSPKILI
jgi:hypothetical protein